MPEWRTFRVVDVEVGAASFAEVIARVVAAPASGERLSIHFATAHSIVEAHGDQGLRDALARGLVEPDGMPLVWLGRRSGLPVERVCGPDFMPAVVAGGVPLGRRHFFYGGAPGVPERLAGGLAVQFPGLQVAGTLSPPFRALSDEEDAEIVALINAARPDYVWVGLGAPKQDLWVAAHRERMDAPVLLAVGAAFDFHAGLRRRAPRWMQRTGTEWIFRLLSEPRRLAGRYTRTNVAFVGLVIASRLRRRRSAGS